MWHPAGTALRFSTWKQNQKPAFEKLKIWEYELFEKRQKGRSCPTGLKFLEYIDTHSHIRTRVAWKQPGQNQDDMQSTLQTVWKWHEMTLRSEILKCRFEVLLIWVWPLTARTVELAERVLKVSSANSVQNAETEPQCVCVCGPTIEQKDHYARLCVHFSTSLASKQQWDLFAQPGVCFWVFLGVRPASLCLQEPFASALEHSR